MFKALNYNWNQINQIRNNLNKKKETKLLLRKFNLIKWKINKKKLKGNKAWNKNKKCIQLSGKNHWNWKNGLSTKERRSYNAKISNELKKLEYLVTQLGLL